MNSFVPMSTFEKVCAGLAIVLGAIFMLMGVFGLFAGVRAHFTLPPVLGVVPFFVGYGICVPLVRYWTMSNRVRPFRSDPGSEEPDFSDDSFHSF